MGVVVLVVVMEVVGCGEVGGVGGMVQCRVWWDGE